MLIDVCDWNGMCQCKLLQCRPCKLAYLTFQNSDTLAAQQTKHAYPVRPVCKDHQRETEMQS